MEENIFGGIGTVSMDIVKEDGEFKIRFTRKNSSGDIIKIWYADPTEEQKEEIKKRRKDSAIMFGDKEL